MMNQKMIVGVINFGPMDSCPRQFSFNELRTESNYCEFYYEIKTVIDSLPIGRRDKEMDKKMWDAIHKIKDLLGAYRST